VATRGNGPPPAEPGAAARFSVGGGVNLAAWTEAVHFFTHVFPGSA
jgi:hypothetical protein